MSSLVLRIGKNAGWISLSKIATSVISYFIVILISRNLGDSSFGIYSFVYSLVTLTFILSDFGINSVFLMRISKKVKNMDFEFSRVLIIKTLLSFLSILFSLILGFVLDSRIEVIKLIFLASLNLVFATFINSYSVYFKYQNRFKYTELALVLERIIAIVFGSVVLVKYSSLLGFVSILVFSHAVALIFLVVLFNGKYHFSMAFKSLNLKTYLKRGLPFFLVAFFGFIYYRIDTLMLSTLVSDQITGWYNSAYKIIDLLIYFPYVLIGASLPHIPRLYNQDKALLVVLYKRLYRYLFTLSVPIVFGIFLISKKLIGLLYGDAFLVGGSESLQYLVFSLPFFFLLYLMTTVLNHIGHAKEVTITTMVCAILNLILNFLLIPKYSYVGASIATVITYFINYVIISLIIKKHVIKFEFKSYMVKTIIASVIMALSLNYFRNSNLFLLIFFGIAIYGGVMMLLGLEKEDKVLISNFINLLNNRFFK